MSLLTALLASTLPLLANGQAQLLPAGPFQARDGRPAPGRNWQLNDATGQAIAARMNARAKLNRIVIDYEHQTLHKERNGQPAPAAGWMGGDVKWEPGVGLVSPVDWTPRASKAIDDKEYLYLSPVIHFDKSTLEVHDVSMAALTNFPAIEGMDALVAALNAQLNTQEPDMALLAALLTALGLPATTTEADGLAAVSALKVTADAARTSLTALTGELGLQAGADATAALTAIKTLKTGGSNTELVTLVASLQGQVAALSAQQTGDKLQGTLDKAVADHKITAAQRETYEQLGKKDYALLTAILDKTPAIPGMGGQTTGDHGAGGTGVAALSATQKSIAKQLGLNEEAYAKQLGLTTTTTA